MLYLCHFLKNVWKYFIVLLALDFQSILLLLLGFIQRVVCDRDHPAHESFHIVPSDAGVL